MELDISFWQGMRKIIANCKIVIDRPIGTPHPRYPAYIYPLEYGYLDDTTASDGEGVDVWVGSLHTRTLTGILCTFDTINRDIEIKLLAACTDEDIQIIQNFHGDMYSLYVPNLEDK